MATFAHFFSLYVSWIAMPCLALIAIFFHEKQKTKESLTFASGIVLMAIGSLISLFSPFRKLTTEEAGKILTTIEPPLSWYAGSIIISVGLIVTVVGFALVTWKIKK